MPGTMATVRQLLERWQAACGGAGATAAEPEATAAGRDLLGRWAQPHRAYHGTGHLTAVLDVIDAHAAAATHPDRVRLAAWWHDAVYDPRAAGDANERASAQLAEATLAALGVPDETCRDVARLVLLTAGHRAAPDDPDGALLCDADLAVLAWPPDRYDRYAAAVRAEYGHVPDEAFRIGRALVLRGLLALPELYRVPALRAAWAQRARANLERELAALTAGAGASDGATRPR